MKDIVVGIVVILIGALFCFRGWLAMRIVIPIWGALGGFALGAGLVQGFTGDGFLSTTFSWVAGLIFAAVFFFLAYLYYEVCVVLAMAFIGFSLGVAALSALGVTWNWVLVLVGIAAGIALGFVAVAANLPMGLLVVLTAFGGATVITTGVMLLFGTIDVDEFDNGVTTKELIHDNVWWLILYLGLAITGIAAQVAFADRTSRTLQEAWSEAGGKSLRAV